MAMNIGEIKHGIIAMPNGSNQIESVFEWFAERTSATTTIVRANVFHRLKGTPLSGNSIYPAKGETIEINGAKYSSDFNLSMDKADFNAGARLCEPMIEHTITHDSEGIENFTVKVGGTILVVPNYTYTYSLSTQTIDLASATTVKILESDKVTLLYKPTSTTSTRGTYSLKTVYSVNQSLLDNYSDITASSYLIYQPNTPNSTVGISTVSFKVNNVENNTHPYKSSLVETSCSYYVANSSEHKKGEYWHWLGDINTRVYHDDDGSKEINFTLNFSSGSLGFTTPSRLNLSINTNEELPTIPRYATILTAPNFSDEDNPTITYSNPAGTAATTLQAAISLDGTTANIGWRDVSKTGVSYTFNLTNDERNTLRASAANAATIQVAFLLKTVIGGNTHTESAQRTLTIVSCNPVLNSTVVDTNAITVALTGDSNKLVKFHSNAKASLNVSLVKGATLAYFEIKNGANYGNTQEFTFNNVENNKFEFLARDSRGNIATKVVTPTMVEYIKLTCNLSNNLPDTSGNYDIKVTGNYFNGSFGAANNTLTVQYRFKTEGGSYGNWVTMATTLSDGTYEATARETGLDYRTTYVVQIKAADKLATITTDERKVKTTPVFSWSNDDFEFNTEVRIKGDLRLKGDGNYGNTLYFGDGSYAYMREGTDDDLTFKATDLTLEATNLYLNGTSQVQINGSTLPNIETGTWDAVLGSSAAVSSYNSRSGWYIKIGNVVTIGWNIDVTCNSGYQSTAIKIAGAPYFPSVSAAGGGILYGAYTTGGLAFEGWVIEESGGAITPRLQPCNNTAAANLNISSTAYYPNGGGNLKCFGSLTYTTDD